MKEYRKYADDYLIFKLKGYRDEIADLQDALDIVGNKSLLAYLSLTSSIKRVKAKIDAIMAVLFERDWTEETINLASQAIKIY